MKREQTKKDAKANNEKYKKEMLKQNKNLDQNIQVVNAEMYKLMIALHPDEFNIFNILSLA